VHTRLPEVLRPAVKGKLADLVNTSNLGRQAGHLIAGLFLSHFVDQNLFRNAALAIDKPKAYSWVHLDIAGSSHNAKHNLLQTEGATGQSVRSLTAWIRSLDLI
jgi:leucyl aminopeptidase